MTPHILQITCHDLGRFLGCYGVRTVRTPNLDALAASGVRCTQMFCTSPACSPSRSSLATGRYPHSNGVLGLTHPPFGWDLHPNEQHVAQLLGAGGYDTHLFGFQHVSSRVERLGFAEFHGFDRLLAAHEPSRGNRVAEEVETFLVGDRPDRPLYLEINLEEAHRPYAAGGAEADTEHGVYMPPYLPHGDVTREEMALLQGAVHNADSAVGRILAALDDAGLTTDTLVIFCADHGIAMPRAKCTLYDPGIGIACLLRWPAGGIDGGRVVSSLLSNIDILPTIGAATGVPLPTGLQGHSFLPTLRGERLPEGRAIYAEKTFHSYYDPMRAMRTQHFKYIRNFSSAFLVEVPGDVQQGAIFRHHVALYHGAEHPPVELYALDDDPWEQHNLAGDRTLAAEQQRLDTQLWTWMAETVDPLLTGPIPSPAYRAALNNYHHLDNPL